ncbi:MAG: HNH endonuclease [Lachnospiraceae bacterium]|nr:HNH endonuclease [Lachnospiraceae bacterium]
MAEPDTEKVGYGLTIAGKYHNTLDIEGFSHMMKDPSYCYKFYWLEAIVQVISEGIRETTFDAVINEMICNAWYSVREFHIHLSGMQLDGQVRDGLERAVLKLSELSNLPANASKVEIKNAIREHEAELKSSKEQLTNMVPYRALAGFFLKDDSAVDWGSVRRLTAYIERINRDVVLLPYTLGPSSKLKKEIYFQPAWMEMIQDHTVSILGWIQYEKVKWLQNNNPEVPGLVYKLAPMDEKMRKLNNVRKLWEGILDLSEVRDVFTGKVVVPDQYDVDHFIPWSFVMNDELWNLMPMDSSLNSAKSNRLPRWDPFFSRFAENQFLLYGFIHEKAGIHKLFEACFRDNLHSIWAGQDLYRKGNSREEFYGILQKNMQPVYDSARRQGYEIWNRTT